MAVLSVPVALGVLLGWRLLGSVIGGGLDRISSGIDFFAEGHVPTDLSVSARRDLIEYNWERLVFTGKGMMAQSLSQGDGMYPHLSYLQAFYDLGILGGLLFLLVSAVSPAALIILRLGRPIYAYEALLILLFLFAQGDHLAHAAPYSWTSLLPAVLT